MEMGTPIEHPSEGTIVDDAMMAAPLTDNFQQSYDQNIGQGTVVESSTPAPIEETIEQPEQPFNSETSAAPPVPSESKPAAVEQTEPEPASDEPEMALEPKPDPTTDANNDDLFGGPSNDTSVDEPADQPVDDMSADDLFGGSDETAPAQSADMNDDDLFGGSSDDAAVEAEGSMDDLFGNPPADTPADQPADEMDDLFGNPPANTNDSMPNTDEQPSIDDLFGDTSSQDNSNVASTISEETSIDDILGSSESTEVTSDEIFDAPSNNVSNEADADFDIDDLFGANTAPAKSVAEESPASIKEAVVQVVSKNVMPTNSLDETRVRTWIDNTGVYNVEGRLIEITDDHVRLLKTNGRTCTVPNTRLCKADAAYVESVREQVESSRLAMLTGK